MRARFVIQVARTLGLFALVAAPPFSNFADADENPNANSARTDVEARGLEFVRKHPSEWEYKETMDVMTDKPVAEANSTQSNDTGVSGSVHGKSARTMEPSRLPSSFPTTRDNRLILFIARTEAQRSDTG